VCIFAGESDGDGEEDSLTFLATGDLSISIRNNSNADRGNPHWSWHDALYHVLSVTKAPSLTSLRIGLSDDSNKRQLISWEPEPLQTFISASSSLGGLTHLQFHDLRVTRDDDFVETLKRLPTLLSLDIDVVFTESAQVWTHKQDKARRNSYSRARPLKSQNDHHLTPPLPPVPLPPMVLLLRGLVWSTQSRPEVAEQQTAADGNEDPMNAGLLPKLEHLAFRIHNECFVEHLQALCEVLKSRPPATPKNTGLKSVHLKFTRIVQDTLANPSVIRNMEFLAACKRSGLSLRIERLSTD
jgi:hypothetical protein